MLLTLLVLLEHLTVLMLVKLLALRMVLLLLNKKLIVLPVLQDPIIQQELLTLITLVKQVHKPLLMVFNGHLL